MIHKNVFLLIFLLVFVNLAMFLIPSFSTSMTKQLIMPYQLWFNGLAILMVFLPTKKHLLDKITF
jgi:hypothetical protein